MFDNSSRVQQGPVEKKLNPWIVRIALGAAIAALIGFSFLPLFAGIGENRQLESATSPATSPSPTAQKAQLQELEKGYQLVLQREPDNQTALEALVKIRLQLISQGLADLKTANVVEPLEKLVQLNPDRTEYAILLGQTYQQAGDREAAARTYRSILATQPGDLLALEGLTGLFLQQNRPEAAIALLQDTLNQAPQANKLQPNSIDPVSVQLLLGQVYTQQQRFSEALTLFDQISQANKNDFRPVFAKALILKQQGKFPEAKPLFDQAATLAPPQFKDQIQQQASAPTPAPAAASPSPTTPTQTDAPPGTATP